ncbi:DUF3043 domain-containing protein [Agrococcus sp. SGAir0287]|uniref:DUF3043 domain-containing protein n=1 Tax=Agrococcus sp. SGAir0287 TaxID=2070347 RepID=UPI0010CCEDAA|nr:DUF3043 domain-containing protein [Agrococcus sp. SGAir0287]QCR19127.1 DUF3043 domain-containing protein [Agrococcus sp. SGAir0287]
MPLFSKPKDVVVPQEPVKTTGKGTATPKRSQQVARNQRPLVPTDRKEAKRESREQMARLREEQRRGFERGDERYLPARDKGEVRRYARDYVDARLNVAMLMIPAMIVVIILTFFESVDVRLIANVVLWAFIAVAVLDCLLLGFLLKRRITAKFGPGHTKGVAWYASMRAAQLPFMRMPKPQVRLFQFPE